MNQIIFVVLTDAQPLKFETCFRTGTLDIDGSMRNILRQRTAQTAAEEKDNVFCRWLHSQVFKPGYNKI